MKLGYYPQPLRRQLVLLQLVRWLTIYYTQVDAKLPFYPGQCVTIVGSCWHPASDIAARLQASLAHFKLNGPAK